MASPMLHDTVVYLLADRQVKLPIPKDEKIMETGMIWPPPLGEHVRNVGVDEIT